MHLPPRIIASLLFALLTFESPAQEAPEPNIATLIQQLGDDDFTKREQAEQTLIDIGMDAVEALRAAVKSKDAEVSFRASRAIKQITTLTAAEVIELREGGRQAFYAGDYEKMIRCYRRLARVPNGIIDDRRWLGHAYQLSSQWKPAVKAYTSALERMDILLDQDTNGPQPPSDLWLDSNVNAVQERAALILFIARIERHFLKDTKAAERTLRRVLHYHDIFAEPLEDIEKKWLARINESLSEDKFVDSIMRDVRRGLELRFPMFALRELAEVQQVNGKAAEALKTWRRIHLVTRNYIGYEPSIDVAKVGQLASQLPKDIETHLPCVTKIDPERLTAEFNMFDAATLSKAHEIHRNYWHFTLAPPDGQEFASLEFGVDIEQTMLRYGGQFSADAFNGLGQRISLGSIYWQRKKEGRAVIKKTFELKPGSRVVEIRAGQWKDKFKVHSIKATAKLRPRNDKLAAVNRPVPGFYFHIECLPKEGTLVVNGKPHRNFTSNHNVTPGRHKLTYSHPDFEHSRGFDLDLKTEVRYGMFINLASPMKTELTTLHGCRATYGQSNNLTRLTDGRWLITWGDRTLHFATSPDLITWTKPWTLEESLLFGKNYNCILPSLYTGKDGKIWLAYFSNRLDIDQLSSGGYRLFLTHSKDGKEWSPPRPMQVQVSGWPPGNVQMFDGPDDKFWMLYRLNLARADSPAEISKFQELDIPVTPTQRSHARNTFATFDDAGNMHLVWDHFALSLQYARQDKDGEWTEPINITPKDHPSQVSCPQLFMHNEEFLLTHAHHGGQFRRGTFKDGRLELGEPIKVTHHAAPIIASTNADGRFRLLCGKDAVWVQSLTERD